MSDEGMRTVEHVTCLGCGCACDDITVVVRDGRIAEAQRACSLGAAWFGDGHVPQRVLSGGNEVELGRAIDDAASLLALGERVLVYLAGDISCEVQRAGVALADHLRAALDTLTTATALGGILAAQRRGRASATLGEVRNRSDLLVFWGVAPAHNYPRFTTRYAPLPTGMYVPGGRSDRGVIAVDVGDTRAIADADERIHFRVDEEVTALTLMRAALLGRATPSSSANDLAARAAQLVHRLSGARYVTVVYDGDPSAAPHPTRAEALVTLTQALNASTRCALIALRAGGNRSGADAVLTWQTGFPLAVDFARGAPRYRPGEGAAGLLARGEIGAALVLGNPATVPRGIARSLADVPSIAIGRGASESAFAPRVAIDTGAAGIHEGGMAMRMDEVPLPLRPSLAGPADTLEVVRALRERLVQLGAGRRRGEAGMWGQASSPALAGGTPAPLSPEGAAVPAAGQAGTPAPTEGIQEPAP